MTQQYSETFRNAIKHYTGASTPERLEIELNTRIDWVKSFLTACAPYAKIEGSRFIDVGCGTGVAGISAWELGARSITAFDYSKEAVHISNMRFEEHCAPIKAQEGNLISPIASGLREEFDFVYCYQVIEHIPREMQFRALKSLFDLVAPGGVVHIDTENSLYPYDRHDTRLPLVRLLSGNLARDLVARLGRGLDMMEPSFGGRVQIHDYLSYDEIIGAALISGLEVVDPFVPHGNARQMFLSMTGSHWFYETFAQYLDVERFMPISLIVRKPA